MDPLPDASPYRSPAWLPGKHLQTILPATLTPAPQPHYRRERWTTPDNDFIDLDWIDGTAGQPVVLLFHGLEGSSGSHYARSLMAEIQRLGWHGVVPHFRGCSGELNRAPRFYHSGDSAEADWILRRIQARFPDVPRYASGVSLGGNVLLRWLGEQGMAANPVVTRAAAISAPLDLAAGATALSAGFNMVYTRVFLRSLLPKCSAKLLQYPGLFDRDAMLASRDLRDFDNVVTAPLHGYADATDYYRRASSKQVLPDIAVPTLVLNARNDPFLPGRNLPDAAQVSENVTLEFPARGGHVGFARPGAAPLSWLAQRMLTFFHYGI